MAAGSDGYDHLRVIMDRIAGPTDLEHPIGLSVLTGTLYLDHELLGEQFTAQGFGECLIHDQYGNVTDEIVEWLELAAAHVRRRQVWRANIGHTSHTIPEWAVLRHPITRLAERLGCRHTHWDELDLRIGPCLFSADGVDVRFTASYDSCHLLLNGRYPDSILDLTGGRPLLDVVGLPRSGDAALDAEVAAVRIANAEQMPPRFSDPKAPDGGQVLHWAVVRLDPVEWLPATKPAHDRLADWYVQHPFHS